MEFQDITNLQNFINVEFRKILKLKLDDKIYNVAISKDHIPQIKNVELDDTKFVISFTSEPIEEIQFINGINQSENGEIRAVNFSHFNSSRQEINQRIMSVINELSESNKDQVVLKHKQLRIAHALIEIIKNMPNKT
ncbi:hypothetical protein [uncultured Tenacibaculum sp.]|uniref:hypothetical protein n=1 Tax=uncultured Tenacibaculum sp. TaxID=174713 RepID=UPI00261CB37F|nr:hypothetical protein [uncultured Tenacibaculum sp.]